MATKKAAVKKAATKTRSNAARVRRGDLVDFDAWIIEHEHDDSDDAGIPFLYRGVEYRAAGDLPAWLMAKMVRAEMAGEEIEGEQIAGEQPDGGLSLLETFWGAETFDALLATGIGMGRLNAMTAHLMKQRMASQIGATLEDSAGDGGGAVGEDNGPEAPG